MSPLIPIMDTSRLLEDEKLAIQREIERVHKSSMYIKGPAVYEFEESFAAFHGEGFKCVGVGNGEDGLVLALKALDLRPGGEVLVPSNDGGFAALACRISGLVPVVVDVSLDSGLITEETLTSGLSNQTVAVIATHLHGSMVDIARVKEFCDIHSLLLIEDCSQAHGASDFGIKVGTTGDVATYSHYPTKNLGAFGDAGSVVTRDSKIAKRIRQLSNYGWEEKYSIGIQGGQNSRLDSIQAAVLKAKLPFLDRNNKLRAGILQKYQLNIKHGRLLIPSSNVSVAHHAVLITKSREQIIQRLNESEISWDIHYPLVVQKMAGLALDRQRETPNADQLTREQISLPCFPTLEPREVDFVVSVINRGLGSQ
jgi:aminotransferase EvaB